MKIPSTFVNDTSFLSQIRVMLSLGVRLHVKNVTHSGISTELHKMGVRRVSGGPQALAARVLLWQLGTPLLPRHPASAPGLQSSWFSCHLLGLSSVAHLLAPPCLATALGAGTRPGERMGTTTLGLAAPEGATARRRQS